MILNKIKTRTLLSTFTAPFGAFPKGFRGGNKCIIKIHIIAAVVSNILKYIPI